MQVSRKFKENVTAWGFFFLSLAVVAILVMGALRSRTSPRSVPVPEQKP
jgi:Na+-transporting methylmalonyl-CoA/oxaloacetate decarboxylase gamma subunit